MSFWKLIANVNNSEGCREAMRLSYKKHLRAAEQGHIGSGNESPHHLGLAGALTTRYMARGIKPIEQLVWAEIAPFMTMPESESVEALAEYVVYKERPADVDLAWLTSMINRALRDTSNGEANFLARMGIHWGTPWCGLLERDVEAALSDEISEVIWAAYEDEGDSDDRVA